jgi:murein DD-endopeptidase MepM/ murein hydrolase activator NlpD
MDLVALDSDKNVYAIADGKVDATPYEANGFGYYVRQLLPDGRRIYYGHMAKGSICVKAGQNIKQGDKLGTMGSTGRSTGAHTHLEIRVPGTSKTSLDITEFTGIPNKIGTYEADGKIDYAEKVQEKCGFEAQTMEYLKAYKWADDLFEKLWKAMK